jgi:hypothetical protein
MGIWIRTQDRNVLGECNSLYIEDATRGNYQVRTLIRELGTYTTKERALAVLDEIQRFINYGGVPLETNVNSSGRSATIVRPTTVYEMPQD